MDNGGSSSCSTCSDAMRQADSDFDDMMEAAEQIGEEEQMQLEDLSRISRSRVEYEKKLKEKCMECILKNATFLHGEGATREQFARIPPLLRNDFVRKLETWADDVHSDLYGTWSKQEVKQVFRLVQLLLDESLVGLDFRVFGKRLLKDRKTWRLMAEKCPNLTHLTDNRERTKIKFFNYPFEKTDQIGNIMPEVLRMRNLEHLQIRFFSCSEEEEVVRLLEAFPNLRSLSFSFKYEHINHDVLDRLFKLQKLESLWIGLTGLSQEKTGNKFSKYLQDELLAKCMRKLPLLQDVDVCDTHRRTQETLHISRLEVLHRPLALRTLRVEKSLKSWTCDMLPQVTDLYLEGPLEDVDQFLGFRNLSVLELNCVSGNDAMKILRNYQNKLEELTMRGHESSLGVFEVDPFELFWVCPNLRVLHWVGRVSRLGNPDLHPVSARHFQHLKTVRLLMHDSWFPARLLMEIISAPHLKEIDLFTFELDATHMQELSRRLQRSEILQHLIRFRLIVLNGIRADAREHFVAFMKNLTSYAPRLRNVRCRLYDDVVATNPIAFLKRLRIPGLQVAINWSSSQDSD